jgi:hypothetical protein
MTRCHYFINKLDKRPRADFDVLETLTRSSAMRYVDLPSEKLCIGTI